jgi:hypothetical protein
LRNSIPILSVLLLVCFGGEPTTKPAVSSQQLATWVQQLDASSPSDRDAAATQLLGLGRDDLAALRKVVQKATPLSPAQVEELRDVVINVFATSEPYPKENKGFLGIRLTPSDLSGADDSSILVMGRIPGFGGYQALRDGDVILSMRESRGAALNQVQFSDLVSSFAPGTVVHLRVLRQGKEIAVAVTLSARPANIQNSDEFNNDRMQAATAYWDSNFAPIVGDSISPSASAN